jgi:uncharacterized protein affecting Mg2+/Co2+ transport
MVTTITEGVKVSIETIYQPEYSNPANDHFMFAYKVSIENMTNYAIRLMSRHWYIFDSNGAKREVEGEGVVGQQPFTLPFSSSAPLRCWRTPPLLLLILIVPLYRAVAKVVGKG